MSPWDTFTSLTPLEQLNRSMEAMREVVANAGAEYRAETNEDGSCVYVAHDEDTGRPHAACLIGHMLHMLGMDLDALARLDQAGAYGGSELAGKLHAKIPVNAQVCAVWQAAQIAQDENKPWGVALQLAEAEAKKFRT